MPELQVKIRHAGLPEPLADQLDRQNLTSVSRAQHYVIARANISQREQPLEVAFEYQCIFEFAP